MTTDETLKELMTMMDQLRINEVKLRSLNNASGMAAYAQTCRGLAHLMAIYNSIIHNPQTINQKPN